MTRTGLRRKINFETGWKPGESLDVVGRACAPESALGRKADVGKIGHLSIHFDESGDRLRLYASDYYATQTLVEITLDAKAFEAAIAKAKSNHLRKK